MRRRGVRPGIFPGQLLFTYFTYPVLRIRSGTDEEAENGQKAESGKDANI
jgi:hypothetical protein